VCGTAVWTQDLTTPPIEPPCQPCVCVLTFFFFFYWYSVLLLLPRLALNGNPLISASWVARVTAWATGGHLEIDSFFF
jgi:hypothetical protein